MDAIRLLGELNAKVQDSTSYGHGLQLFFLFARQVDKDIPIALLSRSSTVPVPELLHMRWDHESQRDACMPGRRKQGRFVPRQSFTIPLIFFPSDWCSGVSGNRLVSRTRVEWPGPFFFTWMTCSLELGMVVESFFSSWVTLPAVEIQGHCVREIFSHQKGRKGATTNVGRFASLSGRSRHLFWNSTRTVTTVTAFSFFSL
jgi:hypothetical protein